MKLLLVNPNTSASVTDLIRAEAERTAAPGTDVQVLTAPFGVAYIETRFEALIGAYAVAAVGLLGIGLASWQRQRRLRRQADVLEFQVRNRRRRRRDA